MHALIAAPSSAYEFGANTVVAVVVVVVYHCAWMDGWMDGWGESGRMCSVVGYVAPPSTWERTLWLRWLWCTVMDGWMNGWMGLIRANVLSGGLCMCEASH